ncbi:flavin reductase family protein [uncultured Paludibaculum sp.]|uniref:flavin reductase family protein n=1 Tax=uncultured Paludibaculum sp. TaxID=1765020 RepID=UPI002AAADA05|nr:flavin reductase family protein [uncultured Paludibaculum sp.]
MSSQRHHTSSPEIDKLDQNLFRRACGAFATGITVATVLGRDGKPHGLTANSFSSVSLDPPLVLVCVAHKAATHGPFSSASSFAINILDINQKDLSVRFASSHPNRFEGLDWTVGELGSPILTNSLAVIQCQTKRKIAAGDHTIFLGEVRKVDVREGKPLLYHAGGYLEFG